MTYIKGHHKCDGCGEVMGKPFVLVKYDDMHDCPELCKVCAGDLARYLDALKAKRKEKKPSRLDRLLGFSFKSPH